MLSINRCVFLGNLTRNPELSATNNGIEVCNFTLAVNRRVANKDGTRDTDFINFTAWRKTAVFIHTYFHKGDKMGVEGSLQVRKYEDKEGNKRTAYEIQVDGAHFCTSKGGGGHVDAIAPAEDDDAPPWVK